METSLPPPMTPPDCDLRGYEFMPFFGQRFLGSRFYGMARRNPRAGLAGIALWIVAWSQRPAASLPRDDFDLCGHAGFGDDLSAWRAAKATALHGFVECSDGRLYHPFLALEAVKAFEMRLKSDKRRAVDRERLRIWRDSRKKDGSETYPEIHSETHFETAAGMAAETQAETRFVAADNTGQDSTKIEEYISAQVVAERPKKSSTRASGSGWEHDDAFMAFYEAYPRKAAPRQAHGAWAKALRGGATPAEIMTGLIQHQFADDKNFIPYPSTWLNGDSWRVTRATSQPAKTATAAAMRKPSGCDMSDAELFEVST